MKGWKKDILVCILVFSPPMGSYLDMLYDHFASFSTVIPYFRCDFEVGIDNWHGDMQFALSFSFLLFALWNSIPLFLYHCLSFANL